MNVKEIIFLFKATSWLFSHGENRKIRQEKKDEKENEDNDDDDDEFKKNRNEINNVFTKRNIDRKYIGIIAKYIIDIGRCKCLIDRGFKKVLYLKYCSNAITTENNVILCLKE